VQNWQCGRRGDSAASCPSSPDRDALNLCWLCATRHACGPLRTGFEGASNDPEFNGVPFTFVNVPGRRSSAHWRM
jgi:hypothetical protein